MNENELKDFEKTIRLFERRHKIIRHNNCCIIETISFYENVLLNNIIKPYLFTENFDICDGINELISDRLSFMDKYKIVCKIAKKNRINNFKEFDKLIKMRNDVAHNISSIGKLNPKTKENKIYFGGKELTWDEYLKELQKWAKLSENMARFIMNIYSVINSPDNNFFFIYCKVIGNCVLVQNNLLYPEPDDNYTCFTFRGLDSELIQYINEEQKYYANE